MSIDSWKIIDNNYLDYLRKFEPRIPLTDYGSNKMKPFFGTLFEVDDLVYVTQVSSPKKRHETLKASIDFHKYFFGKRLIGVINLNYMFPVPKQYISNLLYADIEKYKSFPDEKSKNDYIQFLKLQLRTIKTLNLEKDSKLLYEMKYSKPNIAISKRCFDFKALEQYANDFNKSLLTV
jgi:protein AbiQ